MTNLESFYNLYFRADEKIVMMFPRSHEERIPGMIPARICPDCLQVKLGEEGTDECVGCGAEMVDVLIPNPIRTSGTKNHKQYVCPCCGSRRGLSLMGLRSATEISASISQMFASRFNDDKKTLAFSDNVQDAAHRAGFFNSRTWRFGLRTAIQKYCTEFGAGQNLADFQNGFIGYWHERMTDEQFVSFFIAPNLTWKQAYEDMVDKRKLGKDKQAQILMYEIEQRIKYEIMLEFGLAGKIGRTLEKSSCSVISFAPDDITQIADAVQERTVNELGVLTSESRASFERMVIGYLNLMRTNGAFEDKVFDEYEDHDISSAYRMDNEDFPFGYEFVRKATLREINFGESDMTGEKLSVSGVEEVRKGFRICKYCGKIQPEHGKANHSFACKTRKMTTLMQADAYEECLFLYREFTTEILRLLVPATTMDSSSVKMESFVAAFMLGMKEYFGNVDHLRATVSEVPVPDADYRKQYQT